MGGVDPPGTPLSLPHVLSIFGSTLLKMRTEPAVAPLTHAAIFVRKPTDTLSIESLQSRSRWHVASSKEMSRYCISTFTVQESFVTQTSRFASTALPELHKWYWWTYSTVKTASTQPQSSKLSPPKVINKKTFYEHQLSINCLSRYAVFSSSEV